MNKIVKRHVTELTKFSPAPVLAECRKLLSEGYPEDTRLEIYRNRETPDLVISSIGLGAQYTVKEEPNVHFAKYIAPPFINTPK